MGLFLQKTVIHFSRSTFFASAPATQGTYSSPMKSMKSVAHDIIHLSHIGLVHQTIDRK